MKDMLGKDVHIGNLVAYVWAGGSVYVTGPCVVVRITDKGNVKLEAIDGVTRGVLPSTPVSNIIKLEFV